MEFKVNIGDPKTAKTLKKELKDESARLLIGKKIGDLIKGEILEMAGYEFEITGGSDYCGFPMRKDVEGIARKKILITKGIGSRHGGGGIRKRRTVAGNTIHEKTAQINLKVIKYGKTPLFEEKPKEEEATRK